MQIKKILNALLQVCCRSDCTEQAVYLVITSTTQSAQSYQWIRRYFASQRVQWRFMVLPVCNTQTHHYTALLALLNSASYQRCAHIYLALEGNQDQVKNLLIKNLNKKCKIFCLSAVLEKKLHKKVAVDTICHSHITSLKTPSYRVRLEQVIAFILLLAIFPIMLILMILVKLNSDPGSCFYHQERVGQFGQIFRMTKFRSMRMDAESAQGPQWASYADPRSTKIGAWLRHTHLDELPQLWQVVLGQMSFIGPRPERPHYVKQLSSLLPTYALRHQVKPGITGLAQVKYCYAACFNESKEKLSYDLYYIQHRSWRLDIYILLATVNKVFLKGDLFKFA